METMSQFASEKDLWKARAMRFARALFDVMDGIKDHDIQSYTALTDEECDMISDARRDAGELLNAANEEKSKKK